MRNSALKKYSNFVEVFRNLVLCHELGDVDQKVAKIRASAEIRSILRVKQPMISKNDQQEPGMIRRVALQIGILVLLAFIGCNAYFSVGYLRRTQNIATLTLESAAIQAELSGVLKDLTDMETGQRGYLLTDSPSYLQPYNDAKGRIERDFSDLRAGLVKRMQTDQSLEPRLETLAKSKQAEMDRSISLRQQGYRLRSFKLVDTGEGAGYMDEIRRIVSSLSSTESSNFVRFDGERRAALKHAVRATIVANSVLLAVAASLFGLMGYHARVLAKEEAQSKKELGLRDLQLERLTSALSGPVRSNVSTINTVLGLLLEKYGGFLPRHGQQYAEQIKEAAAQVERLRQDLVGSRDSESDVKAA
jgi:CHASE3 domain sensor protein